MRGSDDSKQYDEAVGRAQAVFLKWRGVPAPERAALARRLGDALREHQHELSRQISIEVGKIRAEALGEVQEMLDIADFAAGLGRRLGGITMASERPGHTLLEEWHPIGPVAVITSFNFPMAVWSWNAMLALVCGNPVIWKPSSRAPGCARAVMRVCAPVLAEAGVPDLLCAVIGSGDDVGQRLVEDTRIPVVSFTGSTQRGRQVAAGVAMRLGRSILELGGNNAAIVLPDADLDLAVRAVLFGAVGTAGQRCTTTRRLILHRDIRSEFLRRLTAAYSQLKIGDPQDSATHVGPLIDAAAVDTMMHAISVARSDGGTLLCGGARLPDIGPRYVSPAIVEMPRQTDIVRTETFAPILYVLTADDLDEAIALNNDVPAGLSSALFTNDLRAAARFRSAAGSDCGIVNVNAGTSGAEVGGAFGGEKDTGGGREAGSDCWKSYMRRQTCTTNHSDALPLAQGIRFEV